MTDDTSLSLVPVSCEQSRNARKCRHVIPTFLQHSTLCFVSRKQVRNPATAGIPSGNTPKTGSRTPPRFSHVTLTEERQIGSRAPICLIISGPPTPPLKPCFRGVFLPTNSGRSLPHPQLDKIDATDTTKLSYPGTMTHRYDLKCMSNLAPR